MKNYSLILLLMHSFVFSHAQNFVMVPKVDCDIMGLYRKTITKKKLSGVRSLKDINPGYPASWIAKYITVDLLTVTNEESRIARGFTDQLTDEQLHNLHTADLGTQIEVAVKYEPEDNLEYSVKQREIKFALSIIPEQEAKYPGGYSLLKDYLFNSIIKNIRTEQLNSLQWVEVIFDINIEGKASNLRIEKSSESEEVDGLIIHAISNMPRWMPAKMENGKQVSQKFKFLLGSDFGC